MLIFIGILFGLISCWMFRFSFYKNSVKEVCTGMKIIKGNFFSKKFYITNDKIRMIVEDVIGDTNV